MGIRAAIFFSAAALAGSFGGLLAAGIAQMHGIGGKAGWAWIFVRVPYVLTAMIIADTTMQILEGLATIFIGAASFWMVHDFPDEATFLSPEDRARVLRRLKDDNQASAEHEKVNKTHWIAAYTDWKTLMFCIVYMGCDGALYAFSLFTPTIIKQLGYTSTTANLLSVPPYALAAILTIIVGFVADRTQQRGLCNIVSSLFGIVGFSMLLGSQEAGVKYAGVFLGKFLRLVVDTMSDHITRRYGHLPLHCEYDRVVLEQCRRCL